MGTVDQLRAKMDTVIDECDYRSRALHQINQNTWHTEEYTLVASIVAELAEEFKNDIKELENKIKEIDKKG